MYDVVCVCVCVCVVRVMYGHMQDIVFTMPRRDAEVATRRYGTTFFRESLPLDIKFNSKLVEGW